jgi:hypothetical protein
MSFTIPRRPCIEWPRVIADILFPADVKTGIHVGVHGRTGVRGIDFLSVRCVFRVHTKGVCRRIVGKSSIGFVGGFTPAGDQVACPAGTIKIGRAKTSTWVSTVSTGAAASRRAIGVEFARAAGPGNAGIFRAGRRERQGGCYNNARGGSCVRHRVSSELHVGPKKPGTVEGARR